MHLVLAKNEKMNALIYAAGLGTRLAQITQNKPKALVEVAGKPMLLHAIEKLIEAGVTRIVVNIHHFADQIIDYIAQLDFPQVEILISDERNELLETGGGLLKAAPMFIPDKPIILYNADVLTGIRLKDMVSYHQQKGGIATLMVKDRPTSRYFLFDENMRLSGWENRAKEQERITRQVNPLTSLAFSGIHIIEPELVTLLGEIRKFSITNGYLDISDSNAIYGWSNWKEYWFDIGTPEKLAIAENHLQKTDYK